MAFAGFPETLGFFAELSRHNERAWFESHRDECERAMLEPAKAFVRELGSRLRELDPKIQAVPRVRGSIHSLERRRRFPRGDARPYRETLDLWFWSGRRRAWDNTGFFLRLSTTGLVLATGIVELQKETLARYREHVLDDVRGSELAAIVAELRDQGYVFAGESYERTPRGLPADHPRENLLRHGGAFATLTSEHPPELGTQAFVDFAFRHFEGMSKLHAWLLPLLA